MRILVTGSSGQIGKELIELLEAHEVTCIDKKDGNNLNNIEVCKRIEKFASEVVFHLAGSFDRLIEPPGFDSVNIEDNIMATHNLLQCVAPKQFIFASSYLVYKPQAPVLYEGMSVEPRNVIGAAKLWAEKMIEWKLSKASVAHARIFRVYSKESNCFINHFANVKRLGGKVNVWNTDGTFDFIHAKDVASALISLFDSNVSGVFNVGTGTGHSVQDVVDMVGVETVRANDVFRSEHSIASIGKIRGMTGWEPKVMLEDGIKEL